MVQNEFHAWQKGITDDQSVVFGSISCLRSTMNPKKWLR